MKTDTNCSDSGQIPGRGPCEFDCPITILNDLVTDQVVLVDRRLKAVCANRAFLTVYGLSTCEVAGRSLGEILNCRHTAGGGACGKSEACQTCGWFQAIESGRTTGLGEQECRILSTDGTAFDFSVKVLPLQMMRADGAMCACRLNDAFAQKRLRVLERVFFHDVTNIAVGIRGMYEVLGTVDADEGAAIRVMLQDSANKLIGEIERLRTLRVAESGDVRLWYCDVSPEALLQTLVKRYQEEAQARHLKVVIEAQSVSFPFETDRDLFQLVLGELLLNAIEASVRNDTVTLGFCSGQGEMIFYVRNPAVLSQAVKTHVFERSFTSKGSGRGVGLYRAKMIAERYLKGKVWFSSQEPDGTTFYVSYPQAAQTS